MESQTAGDGSPLLNLPFDHYERCAITRVITDVIRSNLKRRRLKVLDVGGAPGSLQRFLPDDDVFILDLEAMRCPGYIRADGTALPFKDGVFDVVTCHDTLEHVPADQREVFLLELIRVTADFVIINGPFRDPRTEKAERLVVQNIRDTVGEDHPHFGFLQQHYDLGLPCLNETLCLIKRLGLAKTVIPNGPLLEWVMRMAIKHYLTALIAEGIEPVEYDRWCNKAYVPCRSEDPVYRQAVVVSKRGHQPILRLIVAKLRAGQVQEVRNDDISLPASVVGNALSPYSTLVREGLNNKDRYIASIEAVQAEMQAALVDKDQHLANIEDALVDKDQHIANIEDALADTQAWAQAAMSDKDRHITNIGDALDQKEAALTEKDSHIANIEVALDVTEEQLRQVRQQYQLAASTLGFRLLERARAVINRLAPPGTRRRGVPRLFRKGLRIILNEGLITFLRRAVPVWRWAPGMIHRAKLAPQMGPLDEQYQLWLQAHALTSAQIRRITKEAAELSYRPKVSIVMPVYNSDPAWLREAIESVRGQLYDNWELCIADDASTKRSVRALLREYEDGERIKVAYLKKNQGISAASNAALAMATGEYVGFLDHDDELKPDALYEVAKLLNEQPDLDFIYSDEDKRSPEGRLVQPFFKPDWSPDLLLSTNYVPHFAVYRKRLVDEVGGLRSDCDFSQDYDLALRVTDRMNRIGHVAMPLYTWRMVPGSAASELGAKPKSTDAGKRALADAMQRRGTDAEVVEGPFKNTYRVRYHIQGQPLVSIVIPIRDRVDLLNRCITSIEKKTSYPNYEIVVVDNDSQEEATRSYLKRSAHRSLFYPGEFHYGAMMNFAIREAAGDYVILLNNDTEVISEEWIEAMLEHAQRPEVAAVGARLLYPSSCPQHEGVVIGVGGGSCMNVDTRDYFGLGRLVRNVSAVTAACMMTRRQVFEQLGCFDEGLKVAFHDVDYCLRAREKGFLIVYTPYAALFHHESASRGSYHPQEDELFYRNRWGNPGEYRDPYYNPNLDVMRPYNIGS